MKAPLLVRTVLVDDTGSRVERPDPRYHDPRSHPEAVKAVDTICQTALQSTGRRGMARTVASGTYPLLTRPGAK